jgi:phosphodiesterase/alkaline phosphatase D-like protein
VDRRGFLRIGATGLGVAALAPTVGCAPDEPAPSGVFAHGVAAGLHSDSEVVLWTRVDPRVSDVTDLTWEVATDSSMSNIVAAGNVTASPAVDHTAKVLVGGLGADRSWWYRFSAGTAVSPIGRARTLPSPGSSPDSLRLAFASCQHYSAGFYSAWRQVAERDLDAVVFLGDYIYEIGEGPLGVRWEPFSVALTLDDYRKRYRLYRSDPDLQAAHAAHPWTLVWDDHEVFNDHDAALLAADPARAAAAHQAWFEYLPVWPTDGTQIYRSFRWGKLAELTMTDTRQYRSEHLPASPIGTLLDDAYLNPDRSIYGETQRQWLFDTLASAQHDGVRWKLLGNQVMVAPLRLVDLDEPIWRQLDPNLPPHQGLYLATEAWDGFPAERERMLEFLSTEAIGDVIVLTGDYHAFFQAAIHRDMDDPTSPVLAQEFVVSSISSTPFNLVEPITEAFNGGTIPATPPFAYSDTNRNGIGYVTVTPTEATVTFSAHDARSTAVPSPAAAWTMAAGDPTATRVTPT